MTVYTTEEEQVEQIKKWLQQYGASIVLGIVLALALSYGYRLWRSHVATRQARVAVAYSQLLDSVAANKTDEASAQAAYIKNTFPDSPYAILAALFEAKQAVAADKLDAAVVALTWAQQHSRVEPFKTIAALRLARVYVAQGKPELAAKILALMPNKTFTGLSAYVRGNTLLARGDTSGAMAAFRQALDSMPENTALMPLIQMQYSNVT